MVPLPILLRKTGMKRLRFAFKPRIPARQSYSPKNSYSSRKADFGMKNEGLLTDAVQRYREGGKTKLFAQKLFYVGFDYFCHSIKPKVVRVTAVAGAGVPVLSIKQTLSIYVINVVIP